MVQGPIGTADPDRFLRLLEQGVSETAIRGLMAESLRQGEPFSNFIDPFAVTVDETGERQTLTFRDPFIVPAPISTFDIEALLGQASVREPSFVTPTGGAAGGQPVAAGLEALIAQFQLLLQATEQARLQRQQQFQFASLFANIARADPVTAANLQFGITGEPINPFNQFTQALAAGQAPLSFGGLPPSVQIPVGGSQVDLTTSLTGGQLFGLGQNPAALSIFQGLQELGGIDILGQSQRALIPGGVLPSAPI